MGMERHLEKSNMINGNQTKSRKSNEIKNKQNIEDQSKSTKKNDAKNKKKQMQEKQSNQ